MREQTRERLSFCWFLFKVFCFFVSVAIIYEKCR